jgi:protein-S-isoprenylcysteine O-methyltransferase Ste14
VRILPPTPLDWVLLAVGAATGVIIVIAQQDFFIDSRVPNPKVRALQDVGLVFAVTNFGVLVLRGSVAPAWAVAGISMYVAATLLFLSALESARRVRLPRTLVDDPMPKTLITSGPFAIVRHPFYIAYSLAWLAAPVATLGPLVAVFAVIQVTIYVIAARREERQLEEHFGAVYLSYKNRTGMFVPFLTLERE